MCRPKYTAEPGSFHRENGVLENGLLALQSWLVGENAWKEVKLARLTPMINEHLTSTVKLTGTKGGEN